MISHPPYENSIATSVSTIKFETTAIAQVMKVSKYSKIILPGFCVIRYIKDKSTSCFFILINTLGLSY